MLFPQQNSFRSVIDLSGYWRFKPDPQAVGHRDRWFEQPLPEDAMTIAIPGAWNEQLAERGLMNFVGVGWFETIITLPQKMVADHALWLRIGAADHRCDVWLNGRYVGSHEGGFQPFELRLNLFWKTGAPNRITICVDSRLTMFSLPQDVDPRHPIYSRPGYDRRHLFPPTRFDFFPYGGLTRSVYLVLTPLTHISDIEVRSDLKGRVTVVVRSDDTTPQVKVTILDARGRSCAEGTGAVQTPITLHLSEVVPWSPRYPHLYTCEVRLVGRGNNELDGYELPFGVREIRVEGGRILFNGEPLFLVGFGKHEDFPIVGRGQFRAAYLRDFELMRWVGANSFRTSHYPYDEEIMHLADRLGFLVIDEVPAVSLGFWTDAFEELTPLLNNHKRALSELVERDRNHPSVIAWSVVNEPNLWSEPHYQNETSRRYFKEVYDHVKNLDATRPIIAITIPAYSERDVALESCDVIGINRYYAWYTDPAELEKAKSMLDQELERLFKQHGKPILVTEFGADTVEGYHSTTAQLFTEEFQTAFLSAYLDVIESKSYCAGAHVWNFADFLTPQHFRRVVLNKKGVFSRTRQPKSAAFMLRERWHSLSRVLEAHHPPRGESGFLIPDVGRTTSSKS
jgi:beta-glucuronidase